MDSIANSETGHLKGIAKNTAISSKGAYGAYQLMPGTYAELGYSKKDMEDSIKSREAGTKYMNKMLKSFNGNQLYAVMAYNWGPGNVQNWINKGMPSDTIPEETRKYIKQVLNQDI